MATSSMYSGATYTGMGYGTSTMQFGSTMGYYTSAPPYQPTKQEIAKQKRINDEYAKKEAKRLKNRTLASLSDESKAIILRHAKALLREYKNIERRKQIMSGIKWFFIFLGLAILFNFSRILTIIETMVK